MNANSTAPAPIGRPAAVLGRPPLVRVIEDDAFISDQFARLDGTCGFAVATYPTATSFLAEFDDQRPGCIVIDLVLPDMSGIELLQQLAGLWHIHATVLEARRVKVPAQQAGLRQGGRQLASVSPQ